MKANTRARIAGVGILAAVFSYTTGAHAQSAVTMSDGNEASLALSPTGCILTHKRTNNADWVGLQASDASGNRFEFRLGEARNRPVEVLEIEAAGKPAYGPVSLFDVLEAELMANMDKWSADKIAEQDDMISDADGQPLHELHDIQISVDGTSASDYFAAVRRSELVEKSRVAPVTVNATGINVANSEDFVKATIALSGRCKVLFMSQ
ncbi:MAG: hypothetical protein AB8G17_07390 [Gammaproteobacteria bacterium]